MSASILERLSVAKRTTLLTKVRRLLADDADHATIAVRLNLSMPDVRELLQYLKAEGLP